MPRPRKYDYGSDYPVTTHVRVPIGLINSLEKHGYSSYDIQKELEKSKIVENYLRSLVKKLDEKA